jgi:hypothetical protein
LAIPTVTITLTVTIIQMAATIPTIIVVSPPTMVKILGNSKSRQIGKN